MKYHSMSIEETITLFETSVENGLNIDNASRRLEQYGKNTLAKLKRFTWVAIFIRQLVNPFMSLLIIASVASMAIGEVNDAIVIGLAIAINVAIGFFQEWRAETAAQKLLEYQTKYALARRDGKTIRLDSSIVVPGDIILLSEGSQIPADMRIVESNNLQIEEAALTGESTPVSKHTSPLPEKTVVADRTNMAYSGTHVVRGTGIGIVVDTGSTTELGKIASLVTSTETTKTPLQKKIIRLSWFLGALLVGLTIIVCGIGLWYGLSIHQFISLSIALAVAAVPEGLLITMTVILVVGMRRMLRHNALVRNLLAAETLGSVSVICADKTGTLTKAEPWLGSCVSGQEQSRLLKLFDITEQKNDSKCDSLTITLGVLNNNAVITEHAVGKDAVVGDPLEVALLRLAISTGLDPEKIRQKYARTAELPFSAESKLMATTHEIGEKQLTIVKGAPEVVMDLCKTNQSELTQQAENLAHKGRRLLIIAVTEEPVDFSKPLPKKFIPMSLLVFYDPLRPEAQESVKTIQSAGIHVVMVTGDHPETALSIASEAGIKSDIENTIVGTELTEMSDDDLMHRITKTTVFARVAPHDKIRIVRAWQRHGHVTAMTGDGINDAPALKAADIGVALGSGSDIAHSISGIVLLDDNLATIGAAIREGRIVFDNIRKVIVYLLADAFTQIVLLACALVARLPIPLLPIHILWVNVVTDGLPAMALAAEPGEPEIMKEKPRDPNEPIINTDMKIIIFIVGIITDLILFSMFMVLLTKGFELTHIRTIMFHGLAIATLTYVFSTRSIRHTIFTTNPFSNLWLLIAVAISLVIQLSCSFIPQLAYLMRITKLSITEWGIIFAIAPVKLALIELTKMALFAYKKRKKYNH